MNISKDNKKEIQKDFISQSSGVNSPINAGKSLSDPTTVFKVESVGLDKDNLCEPSKVLDKSLLNEVDVKNNRICEMKIVLQSASDRKQRN